MNKSLIYGLSALVFIALGLWLWNQNSETGSIEELAADYHFTVEDTASVDKIVISDKTPRKVELIRSKGQWFIGNKKVRPDAIEVLLETLRRMEMRNFVPNESLESVLRRMATYGKEVEVYSNGTLVKHFLVGTDTPEQLGTYMMLIGGKLPYAVHIPGFNGYLSGRFITREVLWHDRTLFGCEESDLQEIKMVYEGNNMGFKLEKSNDLSWKFFKQEGDDWRELPAQSEAIKLYTNLFKTLNYEGAITDEDQIFFRKDSLLASTPFFHLQLKTAKGESRSLKAYHIKPGDEHLDAQGKLLKYDPDRLHGILDHNQMVLLQYYGLQAVLVEPGFFMNN